MNDHPLRGEGLRVESTHGIEAHEALVIDVGHNESNLIHVGGGHGFFGGRAAFFECDQVAHVVAADVVGQAAELGQHELADHFLGPRRTGGFTDAG